MSNLNRHPVRRAAVGVLAGTLAFTGGAIAAGVSPANALPGFTFDRLAGADRYETAAEIATNTFPSGATTAIIARGDEFADALAANYLAGVMNAPILLTDSNNLPAATEAALAALGVDDVIIVGGTTAVSASVQAELAADYSVSRLGGADRYLTAELIAGAASDRSNGAVGELNGMRTAILASGQVFADALAAGPIAYAANHPIVLTRPGDLPSSTADVLADLDVEQVIIVGGTAAVSADVEADAEAMVGADAIRIGGATRYETAAMIAEVAMDMFGFDDTHINLARGDVFADALAGGPHAGEEMAPIVLTASDSLSPATEAFLTEHSDTLQDGHIFGGPAAVSQAVEDAAEEAAQGEAGPIALTALTVAQGGELTGTITGDFSSVTVSGCGFTDSAIGDDDDTATAGRQFTLTVASAQATGACTLTFTATPTGGGAAITQTITVTVTAQESNQTFDVNPDDTETRVLVADEAAGTQAEQDADNRTYTASGLTDGTTYRVTLVNNENITVGSNGQVTFLAGADAASSTGFSAVTGDVVARIASVNNAAPSNGTDAFTGQSALVQSVAGSITFTIDGEDVGSVTPVLYVNGGTGGTATTGGTSARLEVQATAADQIAAPSESFGIGGTTTFVASQAASGFVGGTATGTTAATTAVVTAVDKAADAFNTGTGAGARRFNYDANDLFTVDGVSVGLAAFEAALSTQDTVSGTFTRDVAGVSQFNLNDVNPPAPSAVSAEQGTDSASNDITVTVTFPAGTDVDSVVIQRASVTGTGATDEVSTGTVGTFATIATVTTTAAQRQAGVVTFVDNDVAVGTYRYQAALVNDGDQSAFVADLANETSTAPAADTTQPQSEDARVSTDVGFAGLADQGDVFTFAFNEQIAAPEAGDTLRIQDADGTVIDVVAGTNATFALNATAMTFLNGEARAAGEVLTVTLTSAPTTVAGGTTPSLQYASAVVTNSVGVTDVAGNRFDIAGSADTTLNVAANVTTAPTTSPADTRAPLATDATFNNTPGTFGNSVGAVNDPADVITVTYDENIVVAAGATITIDPNSGTAGDEVVYTCGTGVSCTSSGGVLTVTVTDAAVAVDVSLDGVADEVDGTTGIADAAGNEAGGYPRALIA